MSHIYFARRMPSSYAQGIRAVSVRPSGVPHKHVPCPPVLPVSLPTFPYSNFYLSVMPVHEYYYLGGAVILGSVWWD